MSRQLIALTLSFVMSSLQAAEPAKPNTLTPKEIADGWLLLFDGETTFGWNVEGEAKAADGVLKIGGEKPASVITSMAFGPCEIVFELYREGKNSKAAKTVHDWRMPLYFSDPLKWSEWRFVRSEKKIECTIRPCKDQPKSTFELDAKQNLAPFGFSVPAGAKLSLRNIKLKPLELKPVFDGKTLAGWKEHPGKKSKFFVENGSIRIQNGPGDLQSEGQWDDFVLQLECKTNGNRLNSGVFFRCRPGEYQQGYEAQIHNGFNEEKPKEYTIEEFDSKTFKPAGKKKVKNAAMDYGTGAIYRRIPARKQMAKDKEWFTMTVIAAGRHIATWVNGVQVVDWTDNRPLADNARNGCRLEKGPISFQGHDPTTDLNFRNIRIGELKK